MLRSKEQVHSILDDIPNIGEKRRRELMRSFPDIEAIRNADIEELKSLAGMNEKAARSVYDFFHKKEKNIVE